jgi:hypothetical protein
MRRIFRRTKNSAMLQSAGWLLRVTALISANPAGRPRQRMISAMRVGSRQ